MKQKWFPLFLSSSWNNIDIHFVVHCIWFTRDLMYFITLLFNARESNKTLNAVIFPFARCFAVIILWISISVFLFYIRTDSNPRQRYIHTKFPSALLSLLLSFWRFFFRTFIFCVETIPFSLQHFFFFNRFHRSSIVASRKREMHFCTEQKRDRCIYCPLTVRLFSEKKKLENYRNEKHRVIFTNFTFHWNGEQQRLISSNCSEMMNEKSTRERFNHNESIWQNVFNWFAQSHWWGVSFVSESLRKKNTQKILNHRITEKCDFLANQKSNVKKCALIANWAKTKEQKSK